MKTGEKIAVFLGVVFMTLVAYNFIATQAVDILKIRKQADYEILVRSYAAPTQPAWPIHHFLSREPLVNLLPIFLVILAIALIVSGKNRSSGKRLRQRSYQAPNPLSPGKS